jgi:hypothetical protein
VEVEALRQVVVTVQREDLLLFSQARNQLPHAPLLAVVAVVILM